jgi:arsenite oxidase small subunit
MSMGEIHDGPFCLSRRALLLAGGSAATVVGLGPLSRVFAAGTALQVTSYPRKRVARVSQLVESVPVTFRYPWDDLNSTNMLVKLGVEAGGGVGPAHDIVAFSTLCTHMGGPLSGQYRAQYRILGPCPFHLTTFDLTKHGMVAAGQATESLPQIVLEVTGDGIWATGVMGLIFGYHSNLAARA